MNRSLLKYLFALFLFGSNGIIASQITLSSYEIVFLRTMIGSVLLIALFLLSKQKVSFVQNKLDLLFVTISGIAMGTSWMFLYEAYSQTGVSIASLTYYCGPILVMVLAPVIFREKLTFIKLLSFFAVLCGIFFVNIQAMSEGVNGFGIFCGIMSAFMYSAMVIFNKKSKKIVGMENATIQLVVSFLTVAVFAGLKTGFVVQVPPQDWLWILVLGLVNTGVGCYFYFSSIGKLPVQTVAILGYLEPLSAVMLSVFILGEKMLPLQILGAVFIVGGIYGERFSRAPKKVLRDNDHPGFP